MTIARLAKTDDKAATAVSLNLGGGRRDRTGLRD